MYHGRNWLLPEAVESWRRQRPAAGLTSELLILNDCPDQVLVCDVPGVRVVNAIAALTDLSKKQDWIVRLATGDWVAMWDDDDIWLGGRLQQIADFARDFPQYSAHKPNRAWYYDCETVRGRPVNLFFGAATFRREYYLAAGGAVPNEPPDASAWLAMERLGKSCTVRQAPESTQFVYRWRGTGVHDSQWHDKITNEERHRRFHEKVLADFRFQRGEIQVEPRWRKDYEQIIEDALKAGLGNVNPTD
jgi:hypothetical protein